MGDVVNLDDFRRNKKRNRNEDFSVSSEIAEIEIHEIILGRATTYGVPGMHWSEVMQVVYLNDKYTFICNLRDSSVTPICCVVKFFGTNTTPTARHFMLAKAGMYVFYTGKYHHQNGGDSY